MRNTILSFGLILALPLTACISMPEWPEHDIPEEYRDQIAGATQAPEFSQMPNAPDDVPSARQWDAKARQLLSLRGGFAEFETTEQDIAAQIDAMRSRLTAYVNAYKLDDPS